MNILSGVIIRNIFFSSPDILRKGTLSSEYFLKTLLQHFIYFINLCVFEKIPFSIILTPSLNCWEYVSSDQSYCLLNLSFRKKKSQQNNESDSVWHSAKQRRCGNNLSFCRGLYGTQLGSGME